MQILILGSIEVPLFAIATIGFALAVFIDEKQRKRKYAKDQLLVRRQFMNDNDRNTEATSI